MIRSRCTALVLLLALLLALTACQHGDGSTQQRQEKIVYAMDTVMRLTAYGDAAEAGLEAAEAEIFRLESMLDPYDSASELYALNTGEIHTVSTELALLLETCRFYYEDTAGAFDPTVLPLMDLWGFSTDSPAVPAPSEIQTALAAVGFNHIALSGQEVELDAGTELTLGAIAKGYAGAQVAEVLQEAGVGSAVISLGGNVQTVGIRPDGEPWTVAVQDPADTGAYVGTLAVGETAVVTSGGYERYFEADGTTYHHILDPATGYPASSGLVSVTVVCADGARADALSTALFVMGTEEALEYYESHTDLELVLITEDGRVLITPGLDFTPAETDYTYIFLEEENAAGK